jgi:hypothetical protein
MQGGRMMNDKYLHSIQVGDLVKIRSEVSGRLAIVLSIEPSPRTTAYHMHEVEVLMANMRLNFIVYELEKVA